jgi:hypothetical protein
MRPVSKPLKLGGELKPKSLDSRKRRLKQRLKLLPRRRPRLPLHNLVKLDLLAT